MIDDIYRSNSDGIGAMYRNKRGLKVAKLLPANTQEATTFISNLPQDDRSMAIHWRMRTHGDIDKANCHPYDVVPGKLAMMHNGILNTGNDADPTKSDTWHFIEDFLKGPCAQLDGLAHEPSFIAMVGDYIGNNKFVFMDEHGNMSIVNKDQGIEVRGLWFSNTYAWDPAMLIPGYRSARLVQFDNWRGNVLSTTGSSGTTRHDGSLLHDSRTREEFFEAVMYSDAEAAGDVLSRYPYLGTRLLLENFKPWQTNALRGKEDKLSKADREILDAAFEPTPTALGALAQAKPQVVAEALCYYLNWDRKAKPADDVRWEDDEDDSFAEAAEVETYTYQGYEILVQQGFQGFYSYVVLDPTGREVDEGYGYIDDAEALDWAQRAVDSEMREAA